MNKHDSGWRWQPPKKDDTKERALDMVVLVAFLVILFVGLALTKEDPVEVIDVKYPHMCQHPTVPFLRIACE